MSWFRKHYKAVLGGICAIAAPVAGAINPAAGYVVAGACAALGLTATTQYLSLKAAGDLMGDAVRKAREDAAKQKP